MLRNLRETAHLEGLAGSEKKKIFVNTSIIEILIFSYLSDVTAIPNETVKCTCNVTLRRVRATIVAVEKQQVLHILSVCFWS